MLNVESRLQRTASSRRFAVPANTGRTYKKSDMNSIEAMQSYNIPEKGATTTSIRSIKTQRRDKIIEEEMVPFFRIFFCADCLDIMLMAFGTVGAVVQGLAKPVGFLFAGKALSAFGEAPLNNTGAVVQAAHEAIPYVFMNTALLVPGSFLEIWNCWTYSSERQLERCKSSFVEAAIGDRIGILDKDVKTAQILDDLKVDVDSIHDAIGQKMGQFISNSTTFIAGIIVAFISCWELAAAISIIVVPLITITAVIHCGILVDVIKETEQLYCEAGSIVKQSISQIRTVLSYSGEKKAYQSFVEALNKVSTLTRKGGIAKGLGLGLMNAIINCSWAFVIWLGATLVVAGRSQGTRILTGVLCILFGGMSLALAAPHLQVLKKGRVAAFKILEAKKQTRKTRKEEHGIILENLQGNIALQDVYFAYPLRPHNHVLKGISLEICSGKTIALVGSAGSGKSTMLSMMQRIYDPTKGKIKLDGHDIRVLDTNWLKSRIGFIGKEPALFAGTIMENILLENMDAKSEDVEKIADAASLHSFVIELPQKYETQVGEIGSQLSSGQKQKIVIARALLKNPPILLLDLATIPLDAIDNLLLGRTNVVVAHQLSSTIRTADLIVVIDGGEIVEVGKHEELVEKSGQYAKLIGSRKRCLQVSRRKYTTKLAESLKPLNLASPPWPSPFSLGYLIRNLTITARRKKLGAELMIEEGSFNNQESVLKRVLVNMNLMELQELLFGSLGAFLSAMSRPVFGLLMIRIGVAYYDANPKKHINFWSVIFATSGLLAIFSHTIQHYYFAVFGQRLAKKIQKQVYSVILRSNVEWFEKEKNRSGTLSNQLINDAEILKECITDHLCMLVQDLASILVAVFFCPIVNWKMAFRSWWALPWHLVGSFLQVLQQAKTISGFADDAGETLSKKLGDIAIEIANTNKIFDIFTTQDKILETVKNGLKMSTMNERIKSGFLHRLTLCFWQGGHAIAIFYGSVLVQNKREIFVNNIKAYQVFSSLVPSLTELFTIIPALKKANQALRNIFRILDDAAGNTQMDSREGIKLRKSEGDIQFESVDFFYPARPQVPVLRNFNLHIKSGTSVAVVGASGAGKSSVIALMQRLYEPSLGRILFDYQDIKLLDERWLRRQIAVVEEEAVMLSGSIESNILYGSEGVATMEEMEAASKVANVHEFVGLLEEGYSTDVGVLSGGQKHRVAMARGVVKIMAGGGAPVAVVEEGAIRSCGLEEEGGLLDYFLRDKGTTRVFIATGLLSERVRKSDLIIVMEKGRIVETGTHTSLSHHNATAYHKMLGSITCEC